MADPGPPLDAHRLLGDGRTMALLREDGEIDWWCAPLPHDDPLLWSLLDGSGGTARFGEVAAIDESGEAAGRGRTDDAIAGPVQRTLLQSTDGLFVARDALLPARAGGSALVRVVGAVDAPVRVEHLLRIGGFGGDRPLRSGSSTTVGALVWTLHVIGARSSERDGNLVADLALDVGDRPVVLLLTADPSFDVRLDNLLARVDAAADHERDRLARCSSSTVLPHRQLDGLAVLHACSFHPTGAVVAAPTTSIPEAIGADRQFDYRYSWLRDGSLAAAVAAVVGEADAASACLDFLTLLGPERLLEAPVWTVDGEPVPVERAIPVVGGIDGTQPIRVGNEASRQVQYDALGFVAEAIDIVVREGGDLTSERWGLIRAIADRATTGRRRPTAGIWEMREPQMFVDADIGRWMALDHAIGLGDRHHLDVPSAWRSAHQRAEARVRAAVTSDGVLPQVHARNQNQAQPDASGLLAVTCGLFEADEPVATRIIDACIEQLGRGPFVHRYGPDGRDGFAGTEGAFVPASFWVVTALATVGRLDEAFERLRSLDAALPRLLSEEWSVDDGHVLGNLPLVWSHTEAIRATYALESASHG